jgi:hypothetical protein
MAKTLSRKEITDIQVLMRFIGVYCKEKHNQQKALFHSKHLILNELETYTPMLCEDCSRLLTYGLMMRLKCPNDPKPMCKKCDTQCYQGDYKTKIKKIMKFSGMFLIKHGRIDLLYHYLR